MTTLDTIKKPTPMLWFAILFVVAAGLALGLPPDPHSLAQLHISSFTYRVAIFILLFPYALVWYVGFYAYAKLQEYLRTLRGSQEAYAFRKLTIGMGVLAFGLIVPTIISLILNNIAMHHPGFDATIVINEYIALLTPLLAFSWLNSGTHALVATTKIRPQLNSMRWFAAVFLLLSAVFTHLIVFDHNRHHNPYHLSLFWLILTFILPYLYAWFVGLVAAFELRLYARHVKGLLYKRALVQFSSGLTIAILGSIISQFVNSTSAARASTSLDFVLLLDYILVLIIAAGLLMIAFGIRKLKRIEEV